VAELRRNPLTGKWVIYDAQNINRSSLDERKRHIQSNMQLYPQDADVCPFCSTDHHPKQIEIMWVSGTRLIYPGERKPGQPWDVKVIAARNPIFRIEDALLRKGKGFFDTMGSPGAHELIVMSPQHGQAIWDFSEEQIRKVLAALSERMRDLLKDQRLGHQFAYHVYGQDLGSSVNHSVMNIIAIPFVPERIQAELSRAHDWFRIKERCLFCDIYEAEIERQKRGKIHGLVEETAHFTAMVPFFADRPFELWIMPVVHQSDFLRLTGNQVDDLARMLHLVSHRMFEVLGSVPLTMTLMNQPNATWGKKRGYWTTLNQDWHWTIRIHPQIESVTASLRVFNTATGSRVNPMLPEEAAEYLRAAFLG
jgi:UDPglucose--hexose-1-phosphate uridylyltransferase